MAGNIKGVTIEFRGDTTKLDKALRKINTETKAIDSELKKVNNALKFNPGSVELWSQKQELLKTKIGQTKEKLDALKAAQKDMDAAEVDKNSAEYRELQREIVVAESKLKTFKRQLNEVGNVKLKALSEQFKSVGKKMTDLGKTLTTKVTLPLAAVGTVGIKKFAEVDKTMQLTNSTMGNTAEQAELLNKAMKDAASQSTFGMNEAATATLNFARAGLSAEQAASTLAPAMNLAAGEGGVLDTVSAGLVATINGFGDTFDNAATYADTFANACNNSALDINSLSESMSIAAPIFAAAGYDVKDASLYLGVMANNGIDANKAATSLKTGLARLVSPAKDGAAWMDKLGISITNTDGTMKDSVTIQKELNQAFSGLSESEQLAAAAAIFGKNQMSPWLALIRTAPTDVEALNTQLSATGTTTEMAESMMSGFGGSLEKLKSGLDVAATSFGEALAPAISKAAEWIQKLVDWFNKLSPKTRSFIATAGLIVAALGPVLVIMGTVASGIGNIIGLIGKVGPLIKGLKAGIGLLSSGSLLPIIAVIGAVVAAGILLYKNWDKIKATAIKIGKAIASAWAAMKKAVVDKVKGMISGVKEKFQALKEWITGIWDSIKEKTSNAWESIKDAILKPITSAKETIDGIIETIKGWFPIDLSNFFGDIKLPHFSWDWVDIGDFISIPSISIDWYDKGGIFNSPSVIGVGEKRPEFVGALDDLRQIVREESGGEITVNVYAAPGMDINALAAKVEAVLVKQQRQRTAAYGGI